MNAFRSISIADDLNQVGAVEGFRPTRKAMQVVEAVVGNGSSRATSVVAAYGAGKSMAALAGLELLVGESGTVESLRQRIEAVDGNLADYLDSVGCAGQAILLCGAHPDLCRDIARQARIKPRSSVLETLSAIVAKARKGKVRRLAIVWDEFGLHLETLARDGRVEGLLEVQQMAEWAVRQKQPIVTLTTLMHKGVHSYTRRLPESARSDWKKIEGRFETLVLADADPDVYQMIADELDRKRPVNCSKMTDRARRAGFFAEFENKKALTKVLSRSAPLSPAALDLLPRLSGLVAQNERTMFGFIREAVARAEPEGQVGLVELYDYFSPAMRADTGPGGIYRRFMEAETAIARAESRLERIVVKSIALLQLSPAGGRANLSWEKLAFAIEEDAGASRQEIEKTVRGLVKRKLVIHRKRQDDILIWHGSDLDLAEIVRKEAVRLETSRDIVSELEKYFPAPAYFAPRYNYENSITRYARGRYAVAADLLDAQRRQALEAEAESEDALVAIVVDATADRKDVVKAAKKLSDHIIVALPNQFADTKPMMLEAIAIRSLSSRDDLAGADPLVKDELDMMLGEVESALRNSLDPIVNPDRGQVAWIAGRGGGKHFLSNGQSADEILSGLFEKRFKQTPQINNEQVVRRKVSPTSRSSRKRCVISILEKNGLPELGYEGRTSADASIYRTVFAETELYGPSRGEWKWADVSSIGDPKLRRVWRILEKFFCPPSEKCQNFEDLLRDLTAAPVGLREGLLPLMVAAGLQAFGRCVALREEIDGHWLYVGDIDASLIERICTDSSKFTLESRPLKSSQRKHLERMISRIAGGIDTREPDLVRAFYDGFIEWRNGLPASAMLDPKLGKFASMVQPLLRKKDFDPYDFIFCELPATRRKKEFQKEMADVFVYAASEIECAGQRIAKDAEDIAKDLLNRRISGPVKPLREAASAWAETLPLNNTEMRALDHEVRGIVNRARSACQDLHTDVGFVAALSGILLGIGLEAWDVDSATRFRERFENALEKAERSALEKADGSKKFEPLVRNRLSAIIDQLEACVGWSKTKHHLELILQEKAS